MRAYRTFSVLVYLTVLLSVASVGLAEEEVTFLLATAVVAVLAWRADRAGRPVAGALRAVLSAAVLAYALVDLLAWAENFIVSLAHFLNFAVILKLTARKGPRDYLQVLLLSLFTLIVGGYFSSHVLFGVILVGYVIAAGGAAMLLVVLSEEGVWVKAGPSDYAARTLDRARLWGVDRNLARGWRRAWGRVGVYTATVLTLTTVAFLALPRGAEQRFGLPGAGQFQSITGFADHVQLGDLTHILENPAPVMTVELLDPVSRRHLDTAGVPLLWRGLTLDEYSREYRGWGWRKSLSDQGRYIPGQPLSFAEDVDEERLVLQRITLQPIDSRYLFALGPLVRLQNADVGQRLSIDVDDQALRMEEPPPGLRRYEAVSARHSLPPRRPLSRWPQRYLAVPAAIRDQLARLAQEIAPDSLYPSAMAKCSRIERYLRGDDPQEHVRFTYSLAYRRNPGAEPVTDFLTTTRTGHCELFASAMALLLRTQNIPTRIVNGFRGGEWNPFGSYLVVRQQDAHSWVEVYLPGQGWRAFDPTPGGADPAAASQGRVGGSLRQALDYLKWSWVEHVLRYDRGQQRLVFRRVEDVVALGAGASTWNWQTLAMAWDQWEEVVGRAAATIGLGQAVAHTLAVAIGALAVAAVGLILVLLARFLAGRSRPAASPVQFYQTLTRLLAHRGFQRPAAQTPRAFAQVVFAAAPALASVPWITEQYYRVRFGGQALSDEDEARVREALAGLARCRIGRRGDRGREAAP